MNNILRIDLTSTQSSKGSFSFNKFSLLDVVVDVFVAPQFSDVHCTLTDIALQISNQGLYHGTFLNFACFVGKFQEGLLPILDDLQKILHIGPRTLTNARL